MRLIASALASFMLLAAGLCLDAAAAMEESATPAARTPFIRKYNVSELPLWEAGIFAGGIDQPAYPGAADRVSLVSGLPFAIYRGEYLRIDRGTVGVRAIKTPRTEVDIGFSASLGAHADQVEARRNMADIGTLVEFGPRLRINLGNVANGEAGSRIQLPLRAVFDLNDHLAYRGIASELQWVKDMELPAQWVVTTTVGVLFGDQALSDMYYRVAPGEATATRPAYNATGGLIAKSATLLASRLFSNDVRLFGYLRFDTVAGAANHESPLIKQDTGWTAGVGLAWTMSHSDSLARE